jgi:hypothetical protein
LWNEKKLAWQLLVEEKQKRIKILNAKPEIKLNEKCPE